MPTDATAQADRWIRALRVEQDQLADHVRSLGPAQRRETSDCTEWSVAQVLSHLGSGAEINLATFDTARRGQDPPGDDFAPSVWARWDAMDPDQQTAAFLEVSERLVASIEELDDDERADLRVDLSFLPEPADVATMVALRLNELMLHSWDVRVVADPAAVLTPTSVDLLIDRAGLLLRFIGHADAVEPRPVTLAVDTHEPSRSFALELADEVALSAGPADRSGVAVAATVDLAAESFLRLVAGRLEPEHTPAAVRVTGDVVGLDELRRVFPGY